MSVPVAVRCGERLARPRRKPGCAALRAAPDRDESMNMKGHWCSTHGAGTRGQGRPAHVPATKDSARENSLDGRRGPLIACAGRPEGCPGASARGQVSGQQARKRAGRVVPRTGVHPDAPDHL
ncbi:MAG: hypothetical protein ACLQER_10390, partial [Streptosporangiaceae bacterium]